MKGQGIGHVTRQSNQVVIVNNVVVKVNDHIENFDEFTADELKVR